MALTLLYDDALLKDPAASAALAAAKAASVKAANTANAALAAAVAAKAGITAATAAAAAAAKDAAAAAAAKVRELEDPLNKAALKKEGIPTSHAEVFKKIAQEEQGQKQKTKCVIMTRTPGEACSMLLKQGYDAKGFFVKAKSCDWGPMAGFVCLDPLLNKSGVKGAYDNLKSSLYSLSVEFGGSKVEAQYVPGRYDNGKYIEPKTIPARTIAGKSSEATQLVIDSKRFEWLSAKKENTFTKINETMYKCTTSMTKEGKTITIDVVLMKHGDMLNLDKSPKYWRLYYDVFKLYGLSEAVADLQKAKIANSLYLSFIEKVTNTAAEHVQKIRNFWNLVETQNYLSITQEDDLDKLSRDYKTYRPLMAMTNPYLSYAKGQPNDFLNALTGDYDLYAIWPLTPSDEEDTRVAGMTFELSDAEIVRREEATHIGQTAGNISNRIYNIAQMINSNLMSETKYPVNRVFHSDETGRPFMPEVDAAVGFSPDGEVFQIKDAAGLAEAIKYFKAKGYTCYINKGWEKYLPEDVKLLASWAPGNIIQ